MTNGNERANMLASKETNICHQINQQFSYESVNRIIKKKNPRYSLKLINKNGNSNMRKILKDPKLITEAHRKSAVAMFRMITGHSCLSKHLCRIV